MTPIAAAASSRSLYLYLHLAFCKVTVLVSIVESIDKRVVNNEGR